MNPQPDQEKSRAMNRRALLLLIAAVVVVAFATVAIASSLTGSSPSHMMPNGQTMEGGVHDGEDMPMNDEDY